MATLNAKRMLHRELHPQSMEAIENHCNTETGKRLSDTEELPISLLCYMYKLYERLILNRIAPSVDQHLIKEKAGFRPGKSCCSPLLNLTQHIEDGYQRGMITGAAFVHLSAVYDTVNHVVVVVATTRSAVKSVKVSVVQIAKRTN